jgi:uncharacterized protein (DUF2141 family)
MCLGLLINIAQAGENYDISGNVIFDDEGDIYICLYAKENWQGFLIKGYSFSTPECKHMKMSSALRKIGKIPFKFEGVPKGTYTIVAYQDVNGNGKVDIKGFHISEPWESYKERDVVTDMQTWDMVKFDLDKDIEGIEIQMWLFSSL